MKILEKGKIKRIHINQHHIKFNSKLTSEEQKKPVITVKTSKSNDYAFEVEIKGDSKLIYSPDKPLSCGAKVWMETRAQVNLTQLDDLSNMSRGVRADQSIPEGLYCYDDKGVCPFWSSNKDGPEQANGYCSYLKKGDEDFEHMGLLWEQVKECEVL